MSALNRVFITGRSALTSAGATADATWNSVCGGLSGIAEIEQWDLAGWFASLRRRIKRFSAGQNVT